MTTIRLKDYLQTQLYRAAQKAIIEDKVDELKKIIADDLFDLTLINPDKKESGETLFEIAAKNNRANAVAILTMKKQEQGFVQHIKTLESVDLYCFVMRLDVQKDKDFISFFSGDHAVAQEARAKLFNWINVNITCGMVMETVEHKYDNMIHIFTQIYQFDKRQFKIVNSLETKTSLQCLLEGIGKAQKLSERYERDCKNAEALFDLAIKNELKVPLYTDNIKLLTLFKNKILATQDDQLKMYYYRLLFNLDDSAIKPHLHELFYDSNKWKLTDRKKLSEELETDCKKNLLYLVEQQKRIVQQEKDFDKSLAKFIEAKSKNSTHEEQGTPLTAVSFKDKNYSLFQEPKEEEDLVSLEPPKILPPAPIKRLENSLKPTSEDQEVDELDEQIARAKI